MQRIHPLPFHLNAIIARGWPNSYTHRLANRKTKSLFVTSFESTFKWLVYAATIFRFVGGLKEDGNGFTNVLRGTFHRAKSQYGRKHCHKCIFIKQTTEITLIIKSVSNNKALIVHINKFGSNRSALNTVDIYKITITLLIIIHHRYA